MDWDGEMGQAVVCGEVVVANVNAPGCDPGAGRRSEVRCTRVHRRRCSGGTGGAIEDAAQGQQPTEGLEQWEQPDEERRANGSGQRQGAPRGGADGERGKNLSGGARGCESGRGVLSSWRRTLS